MKRPPHVRHHAARLPAATRSSQKYPSWWQVAHTTMKLTQPAHETWWLKRATSTITEMPTPQTSTSPPKRSWSQCVIGNSRISSRYTAMNQSGLSTSFTARGTPSRSHMATPMEPISQ